MAKAMASLVLDSFSNRTAPKRSGASEMDVTAVIRADTKGICLTSICTRFSDPELDDVNVMLNRIGLKSAYSTKILLDWEVGMAVLLSASVASVGFAVGFFDGFNVDANSARFSKKLSCNLRVVSARKTSKALMAIRLD